MNDAHKPAGGRLWKAGLAHVEGGERGMKVSHKITETELCVMEVLWERSDAVATRELLELMENKGKKWKRQTLNTLLFRLEEKGVVSRTRAYVKAAMSREEILQAQTQEILDEYYGGKPVNFLIALMGSANVTAEDAAKLDALLEEIKSR